MSGHARLAPSSASIWGPGGCPGSVRMQELYPEAEETPKAREGTAAHFYATEALEGRVHEVGTLTPNGEAITREMIDCAQDFITDVKDTFRVNGGALHIERRVHCHKSVNPDNDGTPDAYLIDKLEKVVHVWDYKFGHRYIDAWRNWQLVNYAIGVLEEHSVPRSDWHLWTFTLTVAQPRNYHPDGPLREWHTNGAVIAAMCDELALAAAEAVRPDAELRTGKQCRDCAARFACPALEHVAMASCDVSMAGQPVNLPPSALGLELRIIRDAMQRLGYRAEGLEEHALALCRQGVDVPHWRAEYSNGRQRWNDETGASEVAAMGEIYGIELLQPPKPVTPAQAKKAGLDPDLVRAFSYTPRGPMALVPFDQADIARKFS